MLNLCALTGRLVEDPELRMTQNDIPVTSLRLAVQRDYGKDGERETDFFDVVAWRTTAEFVSNHFSKGSMITVTGRLQNRSWTDKDGGKRTKTELIADNAYFGESKPKSFDAAPNPLDFD
jgi:single-strand DNA-binding protein